MLCKEKYGSLIRYVRKDAGEDPYSRANEEFIPRYIIPMGGLWVDYELMTTIVPFICYGRM